LRRNNTPLPEGSKLTLRLNLDSPKATDTARDALRTVTRASHEAVDAVFGQYDLKDLSSYCEFLKAHAVVLPTVEAWLAKHQSGIFADWSRARRTPSLLEDLRHFGIEPPIIDRFVMPDDPASVAGVTYVIEGSRLGSATLAKRVAPEFPCAYLDSPLVMPLWRQFLTQLEQILNTSAARNNAGRAAIMTFDHFRMASQKLN
jgi:heme oxygenase